MENSENRDYSFVQEKIKPKNHKKLKKALLIVGTAAASAVVFGVVARFTFEMSAKPVEKLLGVSIVKDDPNQQENPRSQVTLSSKTPQGSQPAGSQQGGENPDSGNNPVTGTVSNNKTEPDTKITPAPGSDSKTAESGPEAESVGNGGTGKTPAGDGSGDTAKSEASPGENSSDGSSNATEGSQPVTRTPEEIQTGADGTDTASDRADEDDISASGGESETGAVSAVSGAEDGQDKGMTDDSDSDKFGAAEQQIAPSPLEAYMAMMGELKAVAQSSMTSLARVYAITGGVNWLDESVEKRSEQTGVIMGANGIELLIVSSAAGLVSADRIEVEFTDGTVIAGTLFGSDEATDLAVVAVSLSDLPSEEEIYCFMNVGTMEDIFDGQPVIAVGRPNGYFGAVEYGFVSHTGHIEYITDGIMNEFTTDIIYPENSDGVIINLEGELLGFIPCGRETIRGGIIAADSVRDILIKLLNDTPRVLFGIRAEDMPADVLEGMNLQNGIYVNETVTGSPAAEAGIKKGDVIVKIAGRDVESVDGFARMISEYSGGETVRVEIYRSSNREQSEMITDVILITK